MEETKLKSRRGFAAMAPERRREIASLGGKRAHEVGTAHKWTSDEARAAGSKGGKSIASREGHMSTIGKVGGRRKQELSREKRATGGPEAPKAEGEE